MGVSEWEVGNVKEDGVGILLNLLDITVEPSVSIIPGRVLCADCR